MKRNIFLMSLILSLLITLPKSTCNDNQKGAQCMESNNPFIEKACAGSVYRDHCVQSLKSLPPSDTCDIKTLTINSINITKTYGLIVRAWINQKLEYSNLDPHVKFALRECSNEYGDALEDLNRNIESFSIAKRIDHRFFHDLNTLMSGAISSIIACEDVMKEFKGKDVMEDRNKVFKKHCANALSVIVFWSHNHDY
ncbi:uncharacterized protein LOC130826651 [Amaranthus tricolor]|uniref:uncharacterized protein LOC130826651 n=1 Tax=Amaranthus tricolor TaxID=29722 RepID=UPI00258B08B2|nr:uncharacterized protein LOC130826651 [Amaranthus tricolor]